MIWRIDESSPPGVSSVRSTAAAPSSCAWAIPLSTWSAMNGSTTPSIRSSITTGLADCASGPGRRRRQPGDREGGEGEATSKVHQVTETIIAPAWVDGAYAGPRATRGRARVLRRGPGGRRPGGGRCRRAVRGVGLADRSRDQGPDDRVVVAPGMPRPAAEPPHRAAHVRGVRRRDAAGPAGRASRMGRRDPRGLPAPVRARVPRPPGSARRPLRRGRPRVDAPRQHVGVQLSLRGRDDHLVATRLRTRRSTSTPSRTRTSTAIGSRRGGAAGTSTAPTSARGWWWTATRSGAPSTGSAGSGAGTGRPSRTTSTSPRTVTDPGGGRVGSSAYCNVMNLARGGTE